MVDDLGVEDTARATIEVTTETPVDDIVEAFGIPGYHAAAIVAGLLAYTLLRKAKPNGKMRHHGSPVHGLHPWIV